MARNYNQGRETSRSTLGSDGSGSGRALRIPDYDEDEDDDDGPSRWDKAWPAVFATVWILTGFIGLTCLTAEDERLSAVDSVYLLVQILTTIGYGDLCPKSQSLKLFLAIYVTVGMMIAANAVTATVSSGLEAAHKAVKDAVVSRVSDSEKEHPGLAQRRKQVLSWFLSYIFFLAAGTVFYRYCSRCACTGCDTDKCEETGGKLRTFIDAFYMSCITLTTVGFGDESPQSFRGRLFGIFWMFFGVIAMGNFLAHLVQYKMISDFQKREHSTKKSTFDRMDRDSDGKLDMFEFVTYKLVQAGLVDEDHVQVLIEEFAFRDNDGNGEITYDEINDWS